MTHIKTETVNNTTPTMRPKTGSAHVLLRIWVWLSGVVPPSPSDLLCDTVSLSTGEGEGERVLHHSINTRSKFVPQLQYILMAIVLHYTH